jgi:ATP synthase F1 delta subunit
MPGTASCTPSGSEVTPTNANMKRFTAKQYATALVEAYAKSDVKHRPEVMRSFLQLLVRRRATKLVSRIVTHVQAMEDRSAGVTRVAVASARALGDKHVTQVLEKALGKVVIESSVDPNLIGGLRIQVGDTRIDATLRNRLKHLQTQLTKA